MGDILDSINAVENDLKRSYDICRNTTIYTQDMQDLQVNDNEHLETIMPILYKIVSEVRQLSEVATSQITKIYITGAGTAINNIDLYFQEYIPNAKCELLKPFFISDNASLKLPLKEYLEVNSATALALDGLGYGEPDLNFKGKPGKANAKSLASMKIDSKMIMNFLRSLVDPNKEMTAIDKMAMRLAICLCVGVAGYGIASNAIIKQIDNKAAQIDKETATVTSHIQKIESQTTTVNSGRSAYDKMYEVLDKIKNPPELETPDGEDSITPEEQVVIPKYAIPNLLNRIVHVIPKQVKITSIKNTENKHIVIEAEAPKYQQLGYFAAAMDTNGYLTDLKTTSGTKSGDVISITIEGDLP